MDKKVLANFQLLHSYVKEFDMKYYKDIKNNEDIDVEGEIQFGISDVQEVNDKYKAVIELGNGLILKLNETVIGEIHIVMKGFFEGTNIKKEEFERMLKINGSATLSHLIRAYIYSVTGLSGIRNIVTPMINYNKMFEEETK